ncbi:MAG: toprim domain-containing protein [Bacteroidota bacterium]
MNAEYAKKNISIPELLSRLGHEPVQVKKGGKEYWYKSPMRPNERTASFVTTDVGDKWIWNDFGGESGNIITLVNYLKGYSERDIKPALRFLEDMFPGPLLDGQSKKESTNANVPFSFNQQAKNVTPANIGIKEEEPFLKFITMHEIREKRIYDYLSEIRKIPKKFADLHLLEVKYFNTKKGKQFFAFGMENKSGGFEIRSASDEYSFKSVLNGRDISVINGSSPEKKTVNVFEGMTDFLSLLVMLDVTKLSGDVIIMHSVSTYTKARQFIENQKYTNINTFLDNNEAGQKCTGKFQMDFEGKIASFSHHFSPHVDLNDILRAGERADFKKRILLPTEARTSIFPPEGSILPKN